MYPAGHRRGVLGHARADVLGLEFRGVLADELGHILLWVFWLIELIAMVSSTGRIRG